MDIDGYKWASAPAYTISVRAGAPGGKTESLADEAIDAVKNAMRAGASVSLELIGDRLFVAMEWRRPGQMSRMSLAPIGERGQPITMDGVAVAWRNLFPRGRRRG